MWPVHISVKPVSVHLNLDYIHNKISIHLIADLIQQRLVTGPSHFIDKQFSENQMEKATASKPP